MPTRRTRGPDHAIHPYSPIGTRPPFRLPNGKSVAVLVVLQIDHWELLQPSGEIRDPRFRSDFGSFEPDVRTWSLRDYGNRVGLYRLLEILDRSGLPMTSAVGAGALEAHPEIAEALRRRGHDILAHGLTANRMITSRMTEDEERAHIRLSRDLLADAFGAAPRGWLGQDFGTTPRTSRLLLEEGFDHTLDWANDEQPYLHEGVPGLVALPAPADWDDVQAMALRRLPIDRFPALVADGLDELLRAGADSARCLTIGIHPWFAGAPHRARYVGEVLDAVAARPCVWVTTARDLAGHYRRHLAEPSA